MTHAPDALDEPVAAALLGPHVHLSRRVGRAASYDRAVATFSCVPMDAGQQDWDDLAALVRLGFVVRREVVFRGYRTPRRRN